jgi:metallo-beta-lactamase family protein
LALALQFLGANDTVTGSRTLVTFRGQQWLVDCGLFQGEKSVRDRNWQGFQPDPKRLAGIILTHAHLDHSGYLPRIVREGFKGRILATAGTTDLCRILLRDAAKLEEETASFANRTGYSHHVPAMPLFTDEDAEKALGLFEAQPRRQWITLGPGLSVRFIRAGHIVGASLVQLAVETPAGQKVLTFSGDLGNGRSYILRPADQILETDALVLESTYGDRLQPRTSPLEALAAIVNRTAERGGVLVIPAFAVGRAQELTYMLRLLEDRALIPRVPVILDSPMAKAAMEICLKHTEDQVLDSAFQGYGDAFRPHLFEVSTTPDDSMAACMRDGPMIVISASGMLNGGRILHHLKHRLPDPRNTVLFSGYQAEGTKGRFLQDKGGELGQLRIHHHDVDVEAEIVTIDHLSSHADQQDILEYLERIRVLPKKVFINHGTPAAQTELARLIRERFGIDAVVTTGLEKVELW